jgi:hypothetical protein
MAQKEYARKNLRIANRKLLTAERIQKFSNNIVAMAMIILSIPTAINLISGQTDSLQNIFIYSAITLLTRGANYINVKFKKTKQKDAVVQLWEVEDLEKKIISLESYREGREFNDDSVSVINRLLEESESAN